MPIKLRRGITPSTANQVIRVGMNVVEVVGDADLTAAKIKTDASIFDVTGTYLLTVNGTSDVEATYDGTLVVGDIVYLYLNGETLHAHISTYSPLDVPLGTSGLGVVKDAGVLNDVGTIIKIWG